MSTPRFRATLLGAFIFTLIAAGPAPAIAATGGGVSTAPAEQAQAPAPEGDAATTELRQRTVALTGTQLRSVQRRVGTRADGVLGTGTRRAIRKYQGRKTLKKTGRPNIETLRALKLKLADKLEAKLIAQAQSDPDAATAPGSGHPAAIAAARTAIGTPYRSGGTTTAGFDCSGLVLWAMRKGGVSLPRTSFQQYREGTSVPRDQIQAGDLVFFNTAGPGASHVGIATSPTKVISATSSGVKEHTFASGYWSSHYVGARRV